MQLNIIAQAILNHGWPFYALYGLPPLPVDAAGGRGAAAFDDSWADDLHPGSFVDFLCPKGRWVTGVVVEVSPTATEVSVREEGAALSVSAEWLPVDSDRLAPMGQGKKKHKVLEGSDASQAGSASSAGGPGSVVDDAWRAQLRRGYMCDAQDAVKKWYQAVVVDQKADDTDVSVVKVRWVGRAFSVVLVA